jgi:hypothetical protein
MLVRQVCSTVSAVVLVTLAAVVLVTLVVVLLVGGQMTVTGKHTRSATSYDPVVVDTGTVDHHLAAHSLSDEKESARLLQSTNNITTSCDEGKVPNLTFWTDGKCIDGVDAITCCLPLLNFTTCDEGYYPYLENWQDGVCSSSLLLDCCVTFVTSCDEPGEGRIAANFEWDNINEYSYCYPGISECCGPLQNNSAIMCNGNEPLQQPEYWNDGVCSVAVESGSVVVQSDCCYHEDGITEWIFGSCYESQEQIPGKWSNGNCVASYLSYCCRSVNETSPVFPTAIMDDDGGLSLAAIVGIAVGVAAGLLLVACGCIALGSRRRKDAETGSKDQKGTTNSQEDAGTIYNEVSEPHIGHVIDRNNSDGETIQIPMGLVVELPESETIHIPSHLVMEVLPQTRHHHANSTSPDYGYPVSQKDQCRSVVGEPIRMVNAVAVQQNSDKSKG